MAMMPILFECTFNQLVGFGSYGFSENQCREFAFSDPAPRKRFRRKSSRIITSEIMSECVLGERPLA
jgi:hypothetical protein